MKRKASIALVVIPVLVLLAVAGIALLRSTQKTENEPRAMTLGDVRALAARGETLTMGEVKAFRGVDNLSGLYGWLVDIDETYALQATGTGGDLSVMSAVLYRKEAAQEDGIDIRYYDVDAFIQRGERMIVRPTQSPPGPSSSLEPSSTPGAAAETTEFAQIYIDTFTSYFDIDPGLHGGMEYLAIDMDTLEHATDADKEAIAAHFAKSLGIEVKDASFEDLKNADMVHEGNYIDGILLSIEKVDVSGNTMTIEGVKFRSGLGANWINSVFQMNDGHWQLQESKMTAIA